MILFTLEVKRNHSAHEFVDINRAILDRSTGNLFNIEVLFLL